MPQSGFQSELHLHALYSQNLIMELHLPYPHLKPTPKINNNPELADNLHL